MNRHAERIAALSPEKLRAFQRELKRAASMRAAKEARASQRIARRASPGAVALSFAQERLWFLDRLQPGNAAYNIPVSFRVLGALDVSALKRSVEEVVR